MKNMIRIMKHGVPTYVAPWYKDLTAEGKRMIGATNAFAPGGFDRNQRYKYEAAIKARPGITAEQFLELHADYSSYFAIAAE